MEKHAHLPRVVNCAVYTIFSRTTVLEMYILLYNSPLQNVCLTGKVAEYGSSSSSVHPGFRRAQSHLGCFFYSANDQKLSSIEQQESLKAKTAQLVEKLRPFQDGHNIHVDYIPSPNWKVDFWGENYVDLLKVKIRYDPDNLFTCYHCVGSDRTDFDDMFDSRSSSAAARVHILNLCVLVLSVLICIF